MYSNFDKISDYNSCDYICILNHIWFPISFASLQSETHGSKHKFMKKLMENAEYAATLNGKQISYYLNNKNNFLHFKQNKLINNGLGNHQEDGHKIVAVVKLI